jgi:hypothetical protein
MQHSISPEFRTAIRIVGFAGTLCVFIFAAREMCLFQTGRLVFRALIGGTTFLMLAYAWGMLLGKLWTLSGRVLGCEQNLGAPSRPAVRRRLRTTPIVRTNNRRAYGHNS